MRVEKRVNIAPNFEIERAFLTHLLTFRLSLEYFPSELLRIISFGSGKGTESSK